MIDKINTNQIQDLLGTSSSKQNDPARTSPNGSADVLLQVDYAALIEEAVQNPQSDTLTIEQARKLLLSGDLECAESIRAAAGQIIMFGI